MILVTGATGRVGRHVVRGLVDAGVPVRAMVRDPASAALPDGADVVRGDLSEPATFAAALDAGAGEVDAVFLLWPFLTADAAPPIIDAAAARVRRIVYLSSLGVVDGQEPADAINRFHAAMERLVKASGREWALVRPGGFAANDLGWAEEIRAGGVVREPHAKTTRPLIHEADIAAVAVHALTDPDGAGAVHLVTGPESLTASERVRLIGAAIGRTLRFEELTPEAARAQMVAEGWPADVAADMLVAYAEMEQNPEPVLPGVQDLLGVPARSYRQWAEDHADDFR